MLQSNDNKSSKNITNRQTVTKSDKWPVRTDQILQYPFIDGADYAAMMAHYDKFTAKHNVQAKVYNQLLKTGEIEKGIKRPIIRSQHRRTFEGLVDIFSADLKKKADIHHKTKSINNPFGLVSHLDVIQVNLTGFANRTYKKNGERVRAQEITPNSVTSHFERFAKIGLIEHTPGNKWQNAKVSIFPKFLQISDRDRETRQKTQTLGFEGCQTQKFGVFTLYTSINKNKKEVKAFKDFLPKSKKEIIASAQTPAVGFTRTPRASEDFKEKSTPKNQTKGAENFNVAGIFANLDKKKAEKQVEKPAKHFPLSAMLIAMIGVNNYIDFDNELFNGVHFGYRPITAGDLNRELQYGSLSRTELKKILIRDFAMYASQLWKGKTVKNGTWTNAMYQISKYFEGDMNKQQLVNKAIELRKQLDIVIVSFNNGTFKPFWYPSLYFDQNQVKGGFKQARKLLVKKQKAVAKREERAKKLTPNKNLFKYPENVFLRTIAKYEKNDKNYQTTDKLREKIYGYVHGSKLPVAYKTKIEAYINKIESVA